MKTQVQNYGQPKTQQMQMDDIDESIDADNNEEQFNSMKDVDILTSGSVAGIDQSIDTYRMEEYDYMEEIND